MCLKPFCHHQISAGNSQWLQSEACHLVVADVSTCTVNFLNLVKNHNKTQAKERSIPAYFMLVLSVSNSYRYYPPFLIEDNIMEKTIHCKNIEVVLQISTWTHKYRDESVSSGIHSVIFYECLIKSLLTFNFIYWLNCIYIRKVKTQTIWTLSLRSVWALLVSERQISGVFMANWSGKKKKKNQCAHWMYKIRSDFVILPSGKPFHSIFFM